MVHRIPLPAVWLALLILTLLSVEFIGRLIQGSNGIVAIMVLAAIKALMVVWRFMGFAAAPLAWRIAFGALIGLGATAIALLNVLGAIR